MGAYVSLEQAEWVIYRPRENRILIRKTLWYVFKSEADDFILGQL